jgi:hypothetical protein
MGIGPGAKRGAGERRLRCHASAHEIGLARETPAEVEHAFLELAALLDAEVRMTEIILEALERFASVSEPQNRGQFSRPPALPPCCKTCTLTPHPFSMGIWSAHRTSTDFIVGASMLGYNA